ncbi:ankyrin repeats (3 copies) domain-containing protein [Ditylenchus destructor]|nr:ankyrin repeats (3 copies) domain-containing protein [Ditylenchus destructor]
MKEDIFSPEHTAIGANHISGLKLGRESSHLARPTAPRGVDLCSQAAGLNLHLPDSLPYTAFQFTLAKLADDSSPCPSPISDDFDSSSVSETKTDDEHIDEAIQSTASITITPASGDVSRHHVNLQDKQGRTMLIHNCGKGMSQTVEELAQDPNIDVNIADNEGNTALIHAAQAGHANIVQTLIQHYPKLNLDQTNHLGQTALIKAAIQGRINCAKLLLKAGADAYHRDPSRQMCALEWAEYVGRTECAHMIAHYMLAARNKDSKSANEGLLKVDNGTGNHTPRMGSPAPRTTTDTFKQLACLVAIPLIGGSHDLPAFVRPRVRSAPPMIPAVKITRPSSPAAITGARGSRTKGGQLGAGSSKHRRVRPTSSCT